MLACTASRRASLGDNSIGGRVAVTMMLPEELSAPRSKNFESKIARDC